MARRFPVSPCLLLSPRCVSYPLPPRPRVDHPAQSASRILAVWAGLLHLTLTPAALIAGCGSSSPASQSATYLARSSATRRLPARRHPQTPKANKPAISKFCPASGTRSTASINPVASHLCSSCDGSTPTCLGRRSVAPRQDGSLHMRWALESSVPRLLAPANNTRQHGALVCRVHWPGRRSICPSRYFFDLIPDGRLGQDSPPATVH